MLCPEALMAMTRVRRGISGQAGRLGRQISLMVPNHSPAFISARTRSRLVWYRCSVELGGDSIIIAICSRIANSASISKLVSISPLGLVEGNAVPSLVLAACYRHRTRNQQLARKEDGGRQWALDNKLTTVLAGISNPVPAVSALQTPGSPRGVFHVSFETTPSDRPQILNANYAGVMPSWS